MSSVCIICSCAVRRSNQNISEPQRLWQIFSKYLNFSSISNFEWDEIWARSRNSEFYPFCRKCSSLLHKLIGFDSNFQVIQRQISNVVTSISSAAMQNTFQNNNQHNTITNSNINNSAGKRLIPVTTSNGYIQQPIVIPTWSTNPPTGYQAAQDPSGLIRDWNWRPELAYSSSSTLESMTPDFGISRPDLNNMTSTNSSSSSTLTAPKSKNRQSGHNSRNSDSSQLSSWSKGSEDVLEKFVWGKWECEKLVSGSYICGACGALKSSRQLLVTHLTYHRLLESKRWACKLCGKAFSRAREVERHERTHLTALTNGKSMHREKVETDLGDGQFLYEGQWRYEKVTTLTGDEFRCNTCGTTKNKKSSMLSHLRWVHSLKANNGRKWSISDQAGSEWSDSLISSRGSLGSSS